MSKFFAMVLVFALGACAKAQEKVQPVPPLTPSAPSPVIDLGDVVENVVIAKVIMGFNEQELVVAKFGKAFGKDINASPTKTEIKPERITRKINVNGEEKEQILTVYVPIVTVKNNLTLTEDQRSVGVSKIDAFDLDGKPVAQDVWTKTLQNPKHVLLIREPLSESVKLNPFYAGLLKEDTLLLFIKYQQPAPDDAK